MPCKLLSLVITADTFTLPSSKEMCRGRDPVVSRCGALRAPCTCPAAAAAPGTVRTVSVMSGFTLGGQARKMRQGLNEEWAGGLC